MHHGRDISILDIHRFLGEMGIMKDFTVADENWRIGILRFFIFTFQCASCYFITLIVILRIRMVLNPTGFHSFHKKYAKISVIIIWCFCIVLNSAPIFGTIPEITGPNIPVHEKNVPYLIVHHLGLTTPLVLSVIANIYLSVNLSNIKGPSNNFSNEEDKRGASLQKLINGYVFWLLICNCPYIAMTHYSVHWFNNTDPPTAWKGIEGVTKHCSEIKRYCIDYYKFTII